MAVQQRVAPAVLTVYYDGACPLCRREINFLRRRVAAGDVVWVDVAGHHGHRVATDLDKATALARFHVRLTDGRLVSGVPAFAALWKRARGLRWLGHLAGSRLLRGPFEVTYRGFLKVRPWLQRLVSDRVCDDRACGALPTASVSSRTPSD